MTPQLHDGARRLPNSSSVPLPVIALGTWESTPENREQIEHAVYAALKSGYRHVDTAALYNTEEAVGRAIKRSGVPRSEIVVVTKFWNHMHDSEGVARSLDDSLRRMGLDYVDCYLMHWPIAFKRTADFEMAKDDKGNTITDHELSANHESTWRAMEALVKTGKARSIGVSNFTIPLLEKLLSYAKIKPCCNQVECHPYLPQTKLLEFQKKHDITLTAFSPMGGQSKKPGKPILREDETITKAALKLGVDAAQILISWAVQRGTVPIPKSATPSRIETNFKVPVLPDEVFKEIEEISVKDPKRHIRYCNFDDQWGVELFKNDSGQ